MRFLNGSFLHKPAIPPSPLLTGTRGGTQGLGPFRGMVPVPIPSEPNERRELNEAATSWRLPPLPVVFIYVSEMKQQKGHRTV